MVFDEVTFRELESRFRSIGSGPGIQLYRRERRMVATGEIKISWEATGNTAHVREFERLAQAAGKKLARLTPRGEFPYPVELWYEWISVGKLQVFREARGTDSATNTTVEEFTHYRLTDAIEESCALSFELIGYDSAFASRFEDRIQLYRQQESIVGAPTNGDPSMGEKQRREHLRNAAKQAAKERGEPLLTAARIAYLCKQGWTTPSMVNDWLGCTPRADNAGSVIEKTLRGIIAGRISVPSEIS